MVGCRWQCGVDDWVFCLVFDVEGESFLLRVREGLHEILWKLMDVCEGCGFLKGRMDVGAWRVWRRPLFVSNAGSRYK